MGRNGSSVVVGVAIGVVGEGVMAEEPIDVIGEVERLVGDSRGTSVVIDPQPLTEMIIMNSTLTFITDFHILFPFYPNCLCPEPPQMKIRPLLRWAMYYHYIPPKMIVNYADG